MTTPGYYVLGYRVWWDKGFLWISLRDGMALPIASADVPAVAEMLLRASNDREYNAEERVHSTEEG